MQLPVAEPSLCAILCYAHVECTYFTLTSWNICYLKRASAATNHRAVMHVSSGHCAPRQPGVTLPFRSESAEPVLAIYTEDITMPSVCIAIRDMDFPGNDLAGGHALPAPSANVCGTYCEAHRHCAFFTFTMHGRAGHCYLKDRNAYTTRKTTTGFTSGACSAAAKPSTKLLPTYKATTTITTTVTITKRTTTTTTTSTITTTTPTSPTPTATPTAAAATTTSLVAQQVLATIATAVVTSAPASEYPGTQAFASSTAATSGGMSGSLLPSAPGQESTNIPVLDPKVCRTHKVTTCRCKPNAYPCVKFRKGACRCTCILRPTTTLAATYPQGTLHATSAGSVDRCSEHICCNAFRTLYTTLISHEHPL